MHFQVLSSESEAYPLYQVTPGERERMSERGLPPLSGHTGGMRERERMRERGLPPLSGHTGG